MHSTSTPVDQDEAEHPATVLAPAETVHDLVSPVEVLRVVNRTRVPERVRPEPVVLLVAEAVPAHRMETHREELVAVHRPDAIQKHEQIDRDQRRATHRQSRNKWCRG